MAVLHSIRASGAEKATETKNPNWPEANQLVIYKCDRGFELGTTENNSSMRSGRGPQNGKSSVPITQPRCLLRKLTDTKVNNEGRSPLKVEITGQGLFRTNNLLHMAQHRLLKVFAYDIILLTTMTYCKFGSSFCI